MGFYDKKICPPIIGATYDTFPVSEANCVGMRMLSNPIAHLTHPAVPPEVAEEHLQYQYDRVRDIANIFDEVYATRSGEDLIVRWAIPKHSLRRSAPVMVYVEGSAWDEQSMRLYYSKHGLLLEKGWAIASIKHRASYRAPFPAHLLDAKTGLRYVKSRCKALGLDKDKLVLWGCSSGGHTVTMLAVTRDIPELDTPDYAEEDLSVRGVIDCFGPNALHLFVTEPWGADENGKTVGDTRGPMNLLGGVSMAEDSPAVRRAEPGTYITPERDIPPFLILHGSKDMIVPMGQSVMLYQSLIAAGKDAEFWCVDRAGHETDGFWTRGTTELMLQKAEGWIR